MSCRKDRAPNTLRNLEQLLTELVTSERKYIEKLSLVVNGYLEEFRKKQSKVPVPDDLKDYRRHFVFCNIEDIYDWHKAFFLPTLLKYRQSTLELGQTFLQNESQFYMYTKYSNNVTIAEFIVTEHMEYFTAIKKSLGLDYELIDLLMTPVHRLIEYKSLLFKITENLQILEGDWECVNDAHNMIAKVHTHISDFNALEYMKNYDDDIYEHGKLIFHEYLMCKYEGKKRRRYVFLFKRLLVFTDKTDAKEKNEKPTYTYRLKIPMNKVELKELPNRRFLLKSTDPKWMDLRMICYGDNVELHALWLKEIQKQLQMQTQLINDLVHPSTGAEREVLM